MTTSNMNFDINLTEMEVLAMHEHLSASRIGDYKIDHAAVGFFKLFQRLCDMEQLIRRREEAREAE